MADALLHMDTENDALASGPELAMCMSQLYRDESTKIPQARDKSEMAYTFGADTRDVENKRFPMRPSLVSKEQQKDKTIKAILNKTEKGINIQVIEDHELVCFHDRIIVPRKLQIRNSSLVSRVLSTPR